MNSKKLKMLFISHESSLTGAPILLLSLIKLLKKEMNYDISVCIKRGGPLDESFISIAKTIIIKHKGYHVNKSLFKKIIDYLFYRLRLLQLLNISREADIIFSNTITNGRLLRYLSGTKTQILIYVHELEGAIKISNKFKDVDLSIKLANAFFSPTADVTHNLIANHQVQQKIFPLNYYFHPMEEDLNKINIQKQNFFLKHEIPYSKFYVAGIGTANYRKGIDIFIEASKLIQAVDPNIYFIWIGDFIEEDVREKMTSIIHNENIENLRITGFIPHLPDNLVPFDILALTSREDPYPLVVLESAQMSIPTIGFSGTGGIDDFIENDAGFLLKERTSQALANKILFLKNNRELLKQSGYNAQQKVKHLHCKPSLIIEQFNSAVENVLKH